MSMLKSDIAYMSNVKCQVSSAYVDPWDMLHNFYFDVYVQKSLLKGEIAMVCFTSARSSESGPIIELVPS